MRKKNHTATNIIIGICLISLMGCNSQEPEVQQTSEALAVSDPGTDHPDQVRIPGNPADNMTDHTVKDTTNSNNTANGTTDHTADGTTNNTTNSAAETLLVPTLPAQGSGLMDFIPKGWTLLDSVELDFNEDKIPDYVGVLDTTLPDMEEESEEDSYSMPPRILFAIASDGPGRYRLDFQDINLIRTRAEGGVFGDPYEPLTAEGTSFTTHAYGGSAWKWSEADTYTYHQGVWCKTMSESTYGYGPFVTIYEKDDWEKGIGIRKKRSDDFDTIEKYQDSEDSWDEAGFDIEYEVSLDEAPTLYQAGMRWWLAPERVTDWGIDAIECAEGIELSEDQVRRLGGVYLTGYCDEERVLYTFQDTDNALYYLAMYQFQGKKVTVLAQSDTAIDNPKFYKGKVYYSTELVEEIAYKEIQGQQEEIVTETDDVGIHLNRMNPDGSGKEMIFEYRYLGTDHEVLESRLPYLSLIYEISGDEIVAEVYVGGEPHPVYRINVDGSEIQWIGQIPAES